MIPAGFPAGQFLSAWHRRFPDRRHLWVGSLRLWRADLPVRPAGSDSRLRDWIARASALDPARPAGAARRLGLPEPVVTAVARPDRRPFAFLDLPGGPAAVVIPGEPLPIWPEPVPPDGVPRAVVRPAGVDVVSPSADWRTVPVVRAERLHVAAVGRADWIEVYVAGPDWATGGSPTWTLPAGAIPAATSEAWSAAWREWGRGRGVTGGVRVENGVARLQGAGEIPADGWLLAGDGPLREAAIVVST